MDSAALTKADLELFEKWMKRFRISETYCTPFFTQARENYELYKSYKSSSEKVYKYDVFVPYSFALVEDATANFMLSILASPKLATLKSRSRSIPDEALLEWEELLQWVYHPSKYALL